MIIWTVTRTRVGFISRSRIEIHGIVSTKSPEKCSRLDLTDNIFIQRVYFVILKYLEHRFCDRCLPIVFF
ncbi:hypothetical protein NY2A_b300R [Paramecium bursaria Chlorella virus NY2A]|uniref:Uncharacterized protein b300R n=1 Tax=Paramecium bursaria Chlorella virus NY2A TaxID=46021 RepID=A7IWH5_PBCVN|nr:hypothetical protein NY2A_b300R [Paramecium bursaria Chlorella virus NY2A]ABT14699.1 hypothetical protein NY2A_b300R [Paramecium bursaria Chlorella virus NY2A]